MMAIASALALGFVFGWVLPKASTHYAHASWGCTACGT